MENENAIQGVTARKNERKSGRDRERERESRVTSSLARGTTKAKRSLREIGLSK